MLPTLADAPPRGMPLRLPVLLYAPSVRVSIDATPGLPMWAVIQSVVTATSAVGRGVSVPRVMRGSVKTTGRFPARHFDRPPSRSENRA